MRKGYAVGGLSVGEPRPLSLENGGATESILPRSKPRYAMESACPPNCPSNVARRNRYDGLRPPLSQCSHGYLFTSHGRVIIKHAQYKDDPRPIDENCKCYTCRNYSERTCATCSSPGRFCTRHWRRVTTSGGTLTSCVRLGTL